MLFCLRVGKSRRPEMTFIDIFCYGIQPKLNFDVRELPLSGLEGRNMTLFGTLWSWENLAITQVISQK